MNRCFQEISINYYCDCSPLGQCQEECDFFEKGEYSTCKYGIWEDDTSTAWILCNNPEAWKAST